MATTGHESEAVNIGGLKATLQKFKDDIVDAGLAGKVDNATVTTLTGRVSDIEGIINAAGTADADNIINKVNEMISFLSGIVESDTLVGLLASLKTEIEGEMEHISYDSSTGKLQKTVNGETTDVVTIVNSGFRITEDDTNGIDELTAIGSATIVEDNTNGIDELNF